MEFIEAYVVQGRIDQIAEREEQTKCRIESLPGDKIDRPSPDTEGDCLDIKQDKRFGEESVKWEQENRNKPLMSIEEC